MDTMKIPKPLYAFAVFTCAAIYVVYVKWHLDFKTKTTVNDLESQLKSASRTDQEVLYGIMFDAGSTGTRIHIFKFTQKPKGRLTCFS